MATSLVSANSLLAIDVGTTTTRALLFDVVDGVYRFLAVGSAVSTAGAPFRDVGEGVRRALDELQEISGRLLIRDDESIIVPGGTDGSGVDALVATISAGPPLKVVAIGLLEDVSVESARHLAATTYAEVIETLSLNDRRKQDTRIDLILKTRPDLVIAAGGTEDGADQSVKGLLETVGLSCRLLPDTQRPQVLFAGNKAVRRDARAMMESVTQLHFAPNIRPTIEVEDLDAAQAKLAQIYRQILRKKILGVQEIDGWTGGKLMPTATAFGRIIRFLSQIYSGYEKGVLGIDIGASATTVAAGFSGRLTTGVYPNLGLGAGLPSLLKSTRLKNITRWLMADLSENDVHDYLYQKAAFPASIPSSIEELALEQAVIREVIRVGLKQAAKSFPENVKRPDSHLVPYFEPVLVRGVAFTNAPSPGQSLLTLLDGLQPTGVTTVLLDQSNLAAALGAAADANPTLVAQVLETNLMNLATVISPAGKAQPGKPVLRVKATFDDGNERQMEVKYGQLEVLPVPLGQKVTLRLQPLYRFDVGRGHGNSLRIKASGGILGIVIDARGRPISLHPDAARQRELFSKWLWTLGN